MEELMKKEKIVIPRQSIVGWRLSIGCWKWKWSKRDVSKKLESVIERKGLHVNINKTKVMVSGEAGERRKRRGQWPCSICGRGVWQNSSVYRWCDKRWSGITGNLGTKARIFTCKGCEDQSFEKIKINEEQKEIFLNSEFNFEKVKSFCYLGDIIKTSGGAEWAIRSRIDCVEQGEEN